jgi:hypothetical protein
LKDLGCILKTISKLFHSFDGEFKTPQNRTTHYRPNFYSGVRRSKLVPPNSIAIGPQITPLSVQYSPQRLLPYFSSRLVRPQALNDLIEVNPGVEVAVV